MSEVSVRVKEFFLDTHHLKGPSGDRAGAPALPCGLLDESPRLQRIWPGMGAPEAGQLVSVLLPWIPGWLELALPQTPCKTAGRGQGLTIHVFEVMLLAGLADGLVQDAIVSVLILDGGKQVGHDTGE